MRGPVEALRSQIDDILGHIDLDEWMATWREMQGGKTRERRIQQMIEILPCHGSSIRALDLCCGPGDLGRAVLRRFPDAEVDHVDRDEFFLSLCSAVNRRLGLTNRVLRADLWDPSWRGECRQDYHAVLLANALHWFNDDRLLQIFRSVRDVLVPGGVFVFLEPVSPVRELSERHAAWLASAHPGTDERYDRLWNEFWGRLNHEFGFDYFAEITQRLPSGQQWGDQLGLHALTFVDYLEQAGFREVDLLYRDAHSVTIAAIH